MTLKQFSVRLEISFWQLVIQLLSQSRPVQGMIAWFYYRAIPAASCFIQNLDAERLLRWAAVGLALGFLTGLLTALV